MSKSRSHETSVGEKLRKNWIRGGAGTTGRYLRIRLIHTQFGMFEIIEFVQKGTNMQCTVPNSIPMQQRQKYLIQVTMKPVQCISNILSRQVPVSTQVIFTAPTTCSMFHLYQLILSGQGYGNQVIGYLTVTCGHLQSMTFDRDPPSPHPPTLLINLLYSTRQ